MEEDVLEDKDLGHDGDAGALWDAMYRSRDRVWSGNPNVQLVAEASDLEPGTALDLGCGEGADALWLAGRGWRVTAVDVSAVALERAARHGAASPHGARVRWIYDDVAAWTGLGTFDLVSAQYLHSPLLPWTTSLRTAEQCASVGGTLLMVGHHPDGLAPWSHHTDPKPYFTPEQLAAELRPDQWLIQVLESRPREITGHDGQHATIQDTVLRARRIA
ncbi:bifunctional 2-polyprenyl-6-hydroxyphenol methylase/3-demethylubiquinol 3-O-methyltransferase UbiG [Arthrobacter sp. M4]|uniref:class I SAM-dependent methyltransferase n=1 Tax=Arthrobacter sp. M4 TaxID=218160 RepID=UPI001CDB92F2|nr:class I SAM-dependent methyltransferase [Arthrobacter sp. M4]MCA4134710.1 class I SAM-dependent methyltransferase [Arthrobacter sp. M4]